MCTHILTLLSSGHVLLQFQFLLAQLQYAVLYAVFTDQLNHLHGPATTGTDISTANHYSKDSF